MSQEIVLAENQPQEITFSESEKKSLAENPAAVYLATLRPTGRRGMQQSLDVIARIASNNRFTALDFPWTTLRYQHTAAIAASLSERYRPATVNHALCALRGVLYQAWKLGQLPTEEYTRAKDVKSVKGETLPKGRALAGGELVALLRACAGDRSKAGLRDAALVAILYGSGLRRSEVVSLDLSDYDSIESSLKIRGGKGGRERLVYLGGSEGSGAEAALLDWLSVRGDTAGPLFYPVNKGDKVQPRRMTDQAVLGILKKRGAEANVKSFSPHDLRRTFISDLLDAGADIATVQKLAGHANVQTTVRYDRRGEKTKKKAAGLLHVPYSSQRLP